jgi:hypothetical protein
MSRQIAAGMTHDFFTNDRDDLITRCREKVALRPRRQATADQLHNGVPMFFDQLIRTLRAEQTNNPEASRKISGLEGGIGPSPSEVGVSATLHGRELLVLGFSVDEVAHDYGDLWQSITDLAFERDAPFAVDEFRTLNRCLDKAIADAVTEFTYQHDFVVDNCGGLALGDQQTMFSPFAQRGKDKTGLGLGLSIARKSVEANGGTLTVRDDPGTGWVFTISRPRNAVNSARRCLRP